MDRTILRGVVGSIAHGLNHAGSDIDRLGVFVAPTLEVAGLNWHSSMETRTSSGPDQAEDWTEHEVGKFIKLLLKANPTVTELLWLEDDGYEVMTDAGYDLVRARESFLSRKYVRDAYLGYAKSQRHRLVNEETYKVKRAKHVVRLARQSVGLMRDGFLQVRVDNPQWYHDKIMNAPREQVICIVDQELAWAERLMDELWLRSPLPELPDTSVAEAVLRDIRKDNL